MSTVAKEIKIPALGESIAGGQIAKWHKKDGEVVAQMVGMRSKKDLKAAIDSAIAG